jgi:hypothetical protein
VDDWDDGHPYIRGLRGRRHYFYHPCTEKEVDAIILKVLGYAPDENEKNAFLEKRCGNESIYLCEACTAVSRRDPDRDRLVCRKCKSTSLRDTHELEGVICPKCKKGTLKGEPTAVS